MRGQVWALYLSIGALVLCVLAFITGHLVWALLWGVLTVVGWTAVRKWNQTSPIPMPHSMRWLLFLPRGPLSVRHLIGILQPVPGERILEVGVGPGVDAIPIARSLAPGGVLEALDLQPEMVESLRRRMQKQRVTNIIATQGDAQALPYPNRVFDAAYMIGTLGEIPDNAAALRELRRVLKSKGRLLIGEFFPDPDFIRLSRLTEMAMKEGFTIERTTGRRSAYLALFRPNPSSI